MVSGFLSHKTLLATQQKFLKQVKLIYRTTARIYSILFINKHNFNSSCIKMVFKVWRDANTMHCVSHVNNTK